MYACHPITSAGEEQHILVNIANIELQCKLLNVILVSSL